MQNVNNFLQIRGKVMPQFFLPYNPKTYHSEPVLSQNRSENKKLWGDINRQGLVLITTAGFRRFWVSNLHKYFFSVRSFCLILNPRLTGIRFWKRKIGNQSITHFMESFLRQSTP